MKYQYTRQAHKSSAQTFVPQLLYGVELCPFLISTTCSLQVEPPNMETPHTDNDQGNMPASTYIDGDELCLAPSTGAPGIDGQLILRSVQPDEMSCALLLGFISRVTSYENTREVGYEKLENCSLYVLSMLYPYFRR